MKWLLLVSVFIFNINSSRGTILTTTKEDFESLLNFTELLRRSSITEFDYIARIQAVFCPKQPVCGKHGIVESFDILSSLPQTLMIGNTTVHIEELGAYFSVNCFSCSCSDSCHEGGYCCLTKPVTSDTIKTSRLTFECMVPFVGRYAKPRTFDSTVAKYFMIRKCNYDLQVSNMTMVSKCENQTFGADYMFPVTSVTTGRSYWNQHCAACYNDTKEILAWYPTVHIPAGLVFFSNSSTSKVIPQSQTFVDLYQWLGERGEISFTPPSPLSQSRCTEDSTLATCDENQSKSVAASKRFLYKNCNLFHSPVLVKYQGWEAYMNIFCFLCNDYKKDIEKNVQFNWEYGSTRRLSWEYTVLLDFAPKQKSNIQVQKYSHGTDMKEDTCACYEIYDPYQKFCRPILCPVGEFRIGCQCVNSLLNISGMKVLLKLKVWSTDGNKKCHLRKSEAPVMNAIESATLNQVTTDIVATFTEEDDFSSPYCLHIVIVRSKPGRETRNSLKPLLDYLDNSNYLEITVFKQQLRLMITNKIRLLTDKDNVSHYWKLKAVDFDENKEFLVMSNELAMESENGLSKFQMFSSLLFCKQVQLNENEFIEKNGRIIINATSQFRSVWEYYRIVPNQVRICADEYLKAAETSGTTAVHFFYIIAGTVCFSVYRILIV